MHWLPLVAMVIASALPFPHNPASRIVAATTTTKSSSTFSNQDQSATASSSVGTTSLSPTSHHHDSLDFSSHQPMDYKPAPTDYKPAPVDDDMADGGRQNQKDVFFSSLNDDSGVYELDLVNTLDVPPTEQQTDANVHTHLDFNANAAMHDLAPSTSPVRPRTGLDVASERTEGFVENLDVSPLGLDGLFEDGDVFLDAHPRVLFSTSASPPEHPPELLMFEEEDTDWDALTEGHGDRAEEHRTGRKREKRSHSFDGRWVQRSVCESENRWVTDKTTAVDTRGNKVSIIQEIQTQSGPIKQYFYETRCRQAEYPQGRYEETGVEGATCLGIDKKQWKSKCIAKQSYVRALTKDANNRVGWRWIRIDSSCVCVLMSRTNSRGQSREAAPPARGRG